MKDSVVNLYIAFIIGGLSMSLWMPRKNKQQMQYRNKKGVNKND